LKWLEILRAGKCTRLYPRKWRYSTVKYFFIKWDFMLLLKILYNNWWTANFILERHPCSFYDDAEYFLFDEDYLVVLCFDHTILIFDRSTMNLKHVSILLKKNSRFLDNEVMILWLLQKLTECVFTCFKIKNDIIMCGAIGMIKFYNLSTGEQVMNFFQIMNGKVIIQYYVYLFYRLKSFLNSTDGLW
jgi:hypothetical protein